MNRKPVAKMNVAMLEMDIEGPMQDEEIHG